MTPLDVSPDFSATNGTGLASVVGALLTIVLVASVASIITAAILWAWGQVNGYYQATQKGKTGVLISMGAAALSGVGVVYTNWLIRIGETL